ncbi:F-box protein At5g07610-like [Ipomoea triloba]|uniref:F-box protein At5g07610-like n=1 Tax=Ipomoea triloba TaxID=35885 RepID=UPI00125D6F49|nr:F-box protein At5g07610-like [Ipomoea triloba]
MKLRIKITKSAKQTASAERVSSLDDLLLEILLRLPIRSLIRFKCVSKRWLSLITNPRFSILRNPNPNPAVGLFLRCQVFGTKPDYDYIHLGTHSHTNPPFKKLRFTYEPSGIYILQSCNGLLLCRSFLASQSKRKYYVYNPTTKHFSTLPKTCLVTKTSNAVHEMSPAFNPRQSALYKVVCVSKIIRGMSLAFDPASSPHYKVVCIRDSESARDHYEIEVFPSETGHWRAVGDPFLSNVCFRNSVYWNGTIHWISTWEFTILSFNVYQETRGTMPAPAPPPREGGRVGYFGESCGHLHLVAVYEPPGDRFDVHEMKSDCSEWFVKYRVDAKQVFAALPEMRSDWDDFYAFSIFCLVRGKTGQDNDSFLVLQTPGKAIRFNLVDGSFDKICDLEDSQEHGSLRNLEHAFQYVESLCCV